MSDTKTISWIFLSVAISFESAPIDYNSIKQIADGINHAVPTDKEMQFSINWLIKRGLISKISKKYSHR